MKKIDILHEMKPVRIDPVAEINTILREEILHKEVVTSLAEFNRQVETDLKGFVRGSSRTVYSNKEIKKICMKYDFRLASPTYWKGIANSEVGTEIDKYCEEIGKPVLKNHYGALDLTFKILAPAETFEDYWSYDPILLCKRDDGNWDLVCKWGEDMNASRSVTAFLRHFTFYELRKHNAGDEIKAAIALSLLAFIVVLLVNLFFQGICFITFANIHKFNISGTLIINTIATYLFILPMISNDHRSRVWNKQSEGFPSTKPRD